MGWARWSCRAVGFVVWVSGVAQATAQHGTTTPPRPDPTATAGATTPLRSDAEHKRGAPALPGHAPLPSLHPLVALQHVKAGNAAAAAAVAAHQPLPAPTPRPAGAGRHVCAVIACADAPADLAPLLGFAREDVLCVRMPGPFVSPETTALLERAVASERLSLVVVLAHGDCPLLRPYVHADALTRRTDAVHAEAARRRLPAATTLAQLQRDHL